MMQKTGQRLYTIGEAADLIGVSVPTIRMYEREGLIIPLRKASRHRLFAEGDLERIRSIRRTINTEKVSIAGIRRLMSLVPCWKMNGCSEEAKAICPRFKTNGSPCWIVTGKSWQAKSDECRTCGVYIKTAEYAQMKELLEEYGVHIAPAGVGGE
ncbi:MAG TPA: MerR family transcriptional regulator [Bacteroidota bacterium]|nr:MerR family transcriptional regulator [Bacteroidota bacterium]